MSAAMSPASPLAILQVRGGVVGREARGRRGGRRVGVAWAADVLASVAPTLPAAAAVATSAVAAGRGLATGRASSPGERGRWGTDLLRGKESN